MIRITTWNCCRGSPEVKLPRLLQNDSDILVIQECAHPLELIRGASAWYGDNPRQGLLVLASHRFRIEPEPRKRTIAKFFFPVRVTGAAKFNLLIIWTKPDIRTGHYIDSLFRGIKAYRDFVRSNETLILGDFNSAAYFGPSHQRLVNMLRDEFGLFSAYHQYYQVEHGYETHATYFDRTRKGKPYHIDYCFIPESWLHRLEAVCVEPSDRWMDLSDHVPLTIDVRE